MTTNKTNRTNTAALRIAIAALAVLLFVAALFCGCAAALDDNTGTIPASWTSDRTSQVTTSSQTVSSDTTIDCTGHTLTLSGGSTSSGGSYSWLGQVTINSGCTLTIKNLNIKGSVSGQQYTAAVVGKLLGTGTLVLDHVTLNEVTIICSVNYVGGLVGVADTASTIVMKNCTVAGSTIRAGPNSVGGLVGYADGASCQYTDCIVRDCEIYTSNNDAGGLVGSAVSGAQVATRCTVERSYIYSAGKSSGGAYVGGLVGSAYTGNTKVDLQSCRVADCVIWANAGECGGLVGYSKCNSGEIRSYQNNVVSNCVIYANGTVIGAVGGIIGTTSSSTETQTCTSNTVEYCTIANKGTASEAERTNAGGIAGKFPSAGTLGGNTVKNTVVVSLNGAAAGICPLAAA